MASTADDPTPYTTYIHGLEPDVGSHLMGWRLRAQEQIDGTSEGMSYGMPALRYRGRPLVSIVATKAGFSVFPFSAAVVASVLPELAGFATTKGGIKFTQEHQLPTAVFDRMLMERKAEIDAALGPARP